VSDPVTIPADNIKVAQKELREQRSGVWAAALVLREADPKRFRDAIALLDGYAQALRWADDRVDNAAGGVPF
jgi:hypothetical protein